MNVEALRLSPLLLYNCNPNLIEPNTVYLRMDFNDVSMLLFF